MIMDQGGAAGSAGHVGPTVPADEDRADRKKVLKAIASVTRALDKVKAGDDAAIIQYGFGEGVK
ncbi:MAG: hypothetical protein NTV79_02735 [Candidatus Aureabacteria bacterium]|nr:hypothetical protein [Candidatus Auribacterota bacterium]